MTDKAAPDKFTCFTIAIAYAVLGGMWTFFSDNLFAMLLNQDTPSHHTVAASHWMFVFFSALLLYWMLRVWQLAISHSQQSLHNVNRALRSISECTKAITRITDETQLMKEVCRTFVEVGSYRFAWVGFAQHDEQKNLKPVAYWGYEEGFIESMNASWADCERGRGPAGTTIRTGKTTTFQDFKTNPDYRPWREKALQCGYASGISLPLRDAEGAFGALVIFSDQPHAFDDEEVRRMEELADDLSYGIKTIRMNHERKRVLEERMQLATVIEQASDGVLIIDDEACIQYLNPAIGQIFGIELEGAIGRSLYDFECCNQNELFCFELQKTIFSGVEQAGHFVIQRAKGRAYEINVRFSPVLRRDTASNRYVAIVRDVSHEMQLEGQLRQAQKLEAIATLSGGIAHDFNNILAVIITNAEMSLDELQQSSPLQQHLEIIQKAGFRGKNLVKQILTLSHPAEKERKLLSVEPIATDCLNLLRASLPTTIEVRKEIKNRHAMINADPTQIHQVIMNLCTNAADAMRDNGGLLEVHVAELRLSADRLRNYPGLKPGAYLELQVKDTGHGMGREHMERIFDPFFTSKEHGKGTGLGLSVVHGIVKSHGGGICVSSEPGRGTEFSVLFPSISGQAALEPGQAGEQRGGHERILFVDDEEDYVLGQQRMLEKSGYKVTAGSDSREILGVFRDRPYDFDLVITDQTMPYLTGELLAKEILKLRPDIPIILCSGSAPDSMGMSPERARAIGIREFLLKPVGRHELNQTIRRLLDEAVTDLPRGEYAEYSYY